MKQKEHFESLCFAPPLVNGQTFYLNRYSKFSFPKHFHNEFLVQIITKGTNTFYCNGKTYTAFPGDVVMINAGEVHNGACERDDNLEYKVFYIDAAAWNFVVGNNENLISTDSFFFQRTLAKDAVLFNKINNYFDHLANKTLNEVQYHEKYMDILFYIASKYSSAQTFHTEDYYHKATLDSIKEYIYDNLDDNLSLDKLSKLSAISPFHFLRIFSKHTGLTLHQFILVQRIEKAKRLLKNHQAISDVAFSLGFSDQSHFTRSFKKMAGITPGQFQLLISH